MVAWQPSHRDDIGNGEWHDYRLSGAIVDEAMSEATATKSVKAWELNMGLSGSNLLPDASNTEAFDKELVIANQARARYFISIHIGSDGESGIKGYFTPGDRASKVLAQRLVLAVSTKTSLPNKGLSAEKLYSLQPDRNKATYRVLLEIGGAEEDVAYLQNPVNRKIVGGALAGVLNELGQ